MKTDSENKDGHHHEMVGITINDKAQQTHRGLNAVAHLKHLGGVPAHQSLVEIKRDQHLKLEDDAQIEIHGGERFVSQEKGHHEHLVEIKINSIDRKTHRGENSVAHLKNLGNVPADEILAEFKEGKFVDLADSACVQIHGCEVFASHKPSGGSS